MADAIKATELDPTDSPPETPGNQLVELPDGRRVVLVPRSQLRTKGAKRLTVPTFHALAGGLPTPPDAVDWSKGNSIPFPILGNGHVGDCYYAAMLHLVQAWTANTGREATFDENAVISRYYKLSGGDNGLSDDQVFPEFKAGLLGPNGPHKLLDYMTIKPTDAAAIKLAIYLFGGVLYTASLPNAWLNNASPGAVSDKGVPNPNNGHAMYFSGVVNGRYQDQTWALNPPVQVTPAGVASSDPEIVACHSLDWYDPKTGMAPNGFHYTENAAFWELLGGSPQPPSPYPPKPSPTPVPPTPGPSAVPAVTFAVDAAAKKVYVATPAGFTLVAGSAPGGPPPVVS